MTFLMFPSTRFIEPKQLRAIVRVGALPRELPGPSTWATATDWDVVDPVYDISGKTWPTQLEIFSLLRVDIANEVYHWRDASRHLSHAKSST